jgi:hypothetical protein
MSISAHKTAQCHNPEQHGLNHYHSINLKTYTGKVIHFVVDCNGGHTQSPSDCQTYSARLI